MASASARLLGTLTGSDYTLAIAADGTVYSGSCDHTVRVWCGDDDRGMMDRTSVPLSVTHNGCRR
jgi:hypothetical protein